MKSFWNFFTKLIVAVILAGTGFFIIKPGAVEAGFGVSPGNIVQEKIKPGMEYEQEVILSRSDPTEDMYAIVEPDLGEMESWFTFEPGKKFILPQGMQRIPMTVKVKVPANANLKDYNGIIRIKAVPTEEVTGVSVVKGTRIEVNLITTEISVTDLAIRLLQIPDVVVGDPIKLMIRAENIGNTEIGPTKATIEIQDILQKSIITLESYDIGKVPGLQTKDVYANFSYDLAVGQYYANTKIYLDDKVLREERLAFNVVEKKAPPVPCTESLFYKLSQNKFLFSFIYLLILIILFIIIYKLLKHNKDLPTRRKSLYFVALILLLLALLGLWIINYSSIKLIKQKCPTPSTEKQGTESAQVKGTTSERDTKESANLENTNKEDIKQIAPSEQKPQSQPDNLQGYAIYQQPDKTTKVIYWAKEGENLQVIEEYAQWYRVILSDGTDGYLPKSNVKSAQ